MKRLMLLRYGHCLHWRISFTRGAIYSVEAFMALLLSRQPPPSRQAADFAASRPCLYLRSRRERTPFTSFTRV